MEREDKKFRKREKDLRRKRPRPARAEDGEWEWRLGPNCVGAFRNYRREKHANIVNL
jgi:hypothetical protein